MLPHTGANTSHRPLELRFAPIARARRASKDFGHYFVLHLFGSNFVFHKLAARAFTSFPQIQPARVHPISFPKSDDAVSNIVLTASYQNAKGCLNQLF